MICTEKQRKLPEIIIASHSNMEDISHKVPFKQIIQSNLMKMVNDEYDACCTENEKIDFFKKQLPCITWEYNDKAPFKLVIRSVYGYRLYSSKFIYDIISRWLIPGKRLNITSQFGSDFAFEKRPQDSFILVELYLSIENSEDFKTIKETLPVIASEIRVGVSSIRQGIRILEIKGLNVDDKINLVQESIVGLMNQKPEHFDRDLFAEMQRFFVFSQETFKDTREYRHLVRIICWQYLFRKSMRRIEDKGSQRLLRVKLMKTRLHYPYGAKTVLGVLVGINQIGENERFGEQQITRSIKNCIPSAKLISKSFLSNKRADDKGLVIYAEFEKSDNSRFTFEELTRLRTELPDDLRGRIEQFMHPIFMPRNEEEVMRNILNLSKQLKNHDDIPQIIISFDTQSEHHITYSVVLLRVVKNEGLSVQKLCSQMKFKFELIPDRIKIVGHIKRRYVKEANVFYVRLDKQKFLRKDHSLDLYKARQSILDELYRVFDDVRDYNGGMIAKENELFSTLKKSLKSKKDDFSELILENFFYGITPVIMRSMLEVKLLETSFLILQDHLEDAFTLNDGYILNFSYQNKYVFAYVGSKDPSFQKDVNTALNGLKLTRFQLIQSFMKIEDVFYLGLIFHSERVEERARFCGVIRKSMAIWDDQSINAVI
ncbi:MAG: hypothetical protein S4CHLAM6_04630 [Chlamydiae bacterium]|nr:hypothetical protein [Chlamydiota bacterium]